MPTNEHEQEEYTCTNCNCLYDDTDYCCEYHREEAPTLCSDCFNELYFYCHDCESYCEVDDYQPRDITTRDRADSYQVCDTCYENYDYCEMCESDVPTDYTEYATILEQVICHSCINENDHIIRCSRCEKLFDSDRGGRMAEDSESWYCDSCSDELYYCENCDIYYEGEYCPQCEEDGAGLLYQYSYKPVPVFRNVNQICTKKEHYTEPYMGVELEYSFEDEDYREDVLIYRRDTYPLDEIFYAKQDSSIDDYGAELVSHPCTLAYWQTPKMRNAMSDLFMKIKENNGKIGSCCGYHIHISRMNMTRTHLIRFCLFFAMNKELVATIARRATDNYYAQLTEYNRHTSLYSYGASRPSKYVCVNLQPSDTIEVRAFRGTYNSINFHSALEFVHSIYMFTKHQASVAMCHNKKHLLSDYMCYLQNDKRYKTLYKNIVDNCSDLLYWAVTSPVIPKGRVLFSNTQATLVQDDTNTNNNNNNTNDPNNFYGPNNIDNINTDGEEICA